MVGGVLGQVGIFGQDHRNRFSDVPDESVRQDGLAVDLDTLDHGHPVVDRWDIGDIRSGPDRLDAGESRRGGGIDTDDATMGDRRADNPQAQLVGKREVGREPRSTGQEGAVFNPLDRAADVGHCLMVTAACFTAFRMFW